MEWMLSARSVTDPSSLIADWKRYKGQVIHLGSYTTDDSPEFCKALLYVAQQAEMDVRDECGVVISSGQPATGVQISGPDFQQTMDISKTLLRSANLGMGGVVSAIKAPELSIFVGVRPTFTIGQARGVNTPTKQPNGRNAKP